MELTGTWTLEAFEAFDVDGQVVAQPYGARPLGRISYAADGAMSAILGPSKRPSFGASPGNATDEQWVAAARRFVAYAGTWERDATTVRHHVAVALVPDWVGTTLVREVGEHDGRLVLTIPSATWPRQRLVWARTTPPGN